MSTTWTDARRVLLLTLLREGRDFRQVAITFGCTEDEARTQVQQARAAGLAAIGAKRRTETPKASRHCCRCRKPFAPPSRFIFRCDDCREYGARIYA